MEKTFWEQTAIDIGKVETNKQKKVVFKGTIFLPKIIDIHAECGCTKYDYDQTTRTLIVNYQSGNFPKQVIGDSMIIDKKLIIIYEGEVTETLTIKGIKLRR